MTAPKPEQATELSVQVESKVLSTNLDAWKEDSLAFIADIKTNPDTPEEYGQAKQDIKILKQFADRAGQAKQDILAKLPEVFRHIETIDKVIGKADDKRLPLNREVTAEEARQKKKIVEDAKQFTFKAIKGSPIAHDYGVQPGIFEDAIKGKRNPEKMREAVDTVRDEILNDLHDKIVSYQGNMDLILRAEKEYPGLCHDKKDVALRPRGEVEAVISGRIDNRKLQELEKAEADRKAKEEAERKAAIEAGQKSESWPKQPQQSEAAGQEEEWTPPAAPEWTPPPAPDTGFPVPDSEDLPHTITATFRDQTSADNAAMILRTLEGYIDVEVSA